MEIYIVLEKKDLIISSKAGRPKDLEKDNKSKFEDP